MSPLETARNRIAAGIGDATDDAVIAEHALRSAKQIEAQQRPTTSLRARRVSIRDMIMKKPEPIDMVLEGLPVGALGVVLGQGGIGKSIAMMMMSYAVAIGTDPLGCLLPDIRVTQHGRVVRLCGEDDKNIMHHRMHAFGRTMPEDIIAAMDERIDDIPLVGSAPTLMDSAGNLDQTALALIREAAKGTRLLIIDPLRQFHAGDENDNGMMTVLIKGV